MKTRILLISLLVPFMVMCGKPDDQNPDPTPQGGGTEPVIENPDDAVAKEVKNGDRILVTNPTVEQFITTIQYTERD